MLSPQFLVLALTVAVASACSASQTGRAEMLCKFDILESLPRPETADFFDFYEMTKEEYGYLLAGMMIDGLTPRRPGELEQLRAMIESEIRIVARDSADLMARRGHSFYRYRVSSKDRLDLPLSPIQICLASETQCSCMSRDSFTRTRSARRGR